MTESILQPTNQLYSFWHWDWSGQNKRPTPHPPPIMTNLGLSFIPNFSASSASKFTSIIGKFFFPPRRGCRLSGLMGTLSTCLSEYVNASWARMTPITNPTPRTADIDNRIPNVKYGWFWANGFDGIESDRLEAMVVLTFWDKGRGLRVAVNVDRGREVVNDREDRMTCWNGRRGGIVE